MTRAEWINRPMTRKRQNNRARYEEFKQYRECSGSYITFRAWLDLSRTLWYEDYKSGRNVTRWWEEDYVGY